MVRQTVTVGMVSIAITSFIMKRRLVRIPNVMNQNAKDGVGVTSNRELIRDTIDKLLPFMDSVEQLVECLQFMYGWKIRVTNKSVTFSTADMKQGIRGNKLE